MYGVLLLWWLSILNTEYCPFVNTHAYCVTPRMFTGVSSAWIRVPRIEHELDLLHDLVADQLVASRDERVPGPTTTSRFSSSSLVTRSSAR